MIQLRHIGLYVKDIEKMADFYKAVFSMYPVIEKQVQCDGLIEDIFQQQDVEVVITKLITEQGKVSGIDDMLELIEISKLKKKDIECNRELPVYAVGKMHLGIGVNDIEVTVKNVIDRGGKSLTVIRKMGNGNKCCFCRDPEGNYLELIEQRKI